MFQTAKYFLLAASIVALSNAWAGKDAAVVEVDGPDSKSVKLEVATDGRDIEAANALEAFHLTGLGHVPAMDVNSTALTALANGQGLISSTTLGQGLTYSDYLRTRTYRMSFEFSQSIDVLVRLVNKLKVTSPILSGHSFGGNRALYLQNEIQTFEKIVLWTPGVANSDEFLLSPGANRNNTSAMNLMDSMSMLMGAGKQGENAALEKFTAFIASEIRGLTPGSVEYRNFVTSVEADGMARQALSFDKHDLRSLVLADTFPTQQEIFVVTASEDRVVYPMLHYELVTNARSRGIPAVGIIVAGPGHLILDDISPKAAQAVAKLVQKGASQVTQPFCVVGPDGKVQWLTVDEARELYKFMTASVWNSQLPFLQRAFAGQNFSLPAAWVTAENQGIPCVKALAVHGRTQR